MLHYHETKQLVLKVAEKMSVTEHEVFLISCACDEKYHDFDALIDEWKEGHIPPWFYNFLIDVMADRIPLVTLQRHKK